MLKRLKVKDKKVILKISAKTHKVRGKRIKVLK
jgi:hypothetical protein